MNNCLLVGRLCNDPEIKVINEKGTKVARFNLAVNRHFKNSNGEYETDFFNIVVWNNIESLSEYVHKGDLVGITGRLQNRSYDIESGLKRYVTEVIAENITFIQLNKKEG